MIHKPIRLSSLPVIIDTIKPLQEQVLAHNVCPSCHGKDTLSEVHHTTGGTLSWRQCLSCYAVWME